MAGPLSEYRIGVDGEGPAADEARRLLRLLGADVSRDQADSVVAAPGGDPDAAWAQCGAMWLTGEAGGPPLAPVSPVAAMVSGASSVYEALARLAGASLRIDGPALLAERAAIAGLERQGRTSPGGQCRLVAAADGWVAVNLARPSDTELIPAWLEVDAPADHDVWPAVVAAVADASAVDIATRGQLLGIPVAVVPDPDASDEQLDRRDQTVTRAPFLLHSIGSGDRSGGRRPPLVVDLSSLWAGPLCAHLLGLAGAEVIKVESTGRPDGARSGPAAFYQLLHAGHRSVAIDFGSEDGRTALSSLIGSADIVIEGSRPRALEQLGIHADEVLDRNPRLTWVSITGYGRTGPWNDRVAFGDDAAAAGGLVCRTPDGPLFCGDAIADPATGLYAAVAALACHLGGGGVLVDAALRETARHLAGSGGCTPAVPDGAGGWVVETPTGPVPVAHPRARAPEGPAPPHGADTLAVLQELGIGTRR